MAAYFGETSSPFLDPPSSGPGPSYDFEKNDRFLTRQPLRLGGSLLTGAVNARRCIELPWALLEAAAQEEEPAGRAAAVARAIDTICQVPFVMAKVEAGKQAGRQAGSAAIVSSSYPHLLC